MLIRKIRKKFNRLADNYFTRLLLKNVKPVDIKNSEYIFIFHQVKSKFNRKLYILVSHELSKRGIPSCFKFKSDLLSSYYPRFDIDGAHISNSFTSKKRFIIEPSHGEQLSFKWKVDLENEKMEAEGINFFPLIRNTLRTIEKRYNVVFKDEDNRPLYNELIQSCDLLLKYFLLLKDYSQTNEKKIRLVGFESEYVPNGVLKMLCEQSADNRDIEFIELRRGYISYFGHHHQRDSYIYLSNLTNTKTASGLAVSKEELAGFDEKSYNLEELLRPVSNALVKDMDYIPSDKQKKIIKMMGDYKGRGRKVFVLFPHVFYDTPADDKSKVFNDMCEWIMETVKYFDGKGDLLLIKPHPAEFIKDQPKKTPTETPASFLSGIELPENVIILERDLFTVKDLSAFITCGLIWRSSVGMELTFLGIPCIIAGIPPYGSLDLIYAKDKGNYLHMIEQAHTLQVTDKQKIEVATYLYLLENKHVHVSCIKYDQELREFYWDKKELKQYLKAGDEKIRSVVENMLA